MNENKTIWIALPVYNEWPAIKNLIENLQDVLQSEFDDYMIVICDDGSTDGSKDFINQIGKDENIHVIQHLLTEGLQMQLEIYLNMFLKMEILVMY